MANNYNSALQSNNTDLQAILNTINGLPNAGGSDPVLQDKTVTPTTSSQTITADSGYDGLDTVTVAAIPAQYITTTDATATAADMRSGKTAYVNGVKITGTIQDFDGSYECSGESTGDTLIENPWGDTGEEDDAIEAYTIYMGIYNINSRENVTVTIYPENSSKSYTLRSDSINASILCEAKNRTLVIECPVDLGATYVTTGDVCFCAYSYDSNQSKSIYVFHITGDGTIDIG